MRSQTIRGISRARLGWVVRDSWFLLGVLALGVLTSFILTSIGSLPAATKQPAQKSSSASANIHANTTTITPVAVGDLPVSPVQARSFPINPENVGLMQPAIDADGAVWFGEMNVNLLGRLNTQTGKVTTWKPPDGKYNIMQTAVDQHGNIWYTEQAANYIGRFDPHAERFTVYRLNTVNGHTSAPQDLTFDSAGKLWFTEISGNAIGRLDPATGAMRTWPIPPVAGESNSYPYSLAVAQDGHIWFGELSGGAVGSLDPVSGAVKLYPLANHKALVFSMAADKDGYVWFTELEQPVLGMIDIKTGQVREIPIPDKLGQPSGIYAVTTSAKGSVWFACASINAIVRYEPAKQAFAFYPLNIPKSVPYGLTLDQRGNLWFTGDATPTNYVGELRIQGT